MRFIAVSMLIACAASTSFAEPPKKGGKLPAGYSWETSYEAARLKAAEAGKLLFIDFYTEW